MYYTHVDMGELSHPVSTTVNSYLIKGWESKKSDSPLVATRDYMFSKTGKTVKCPQLHRTQGNCVGLLRRILHGLGPVIMSVGDRCGDLGQC